MPKAFPQRASLETPNVDVAAADDDVVDAERVLEDEWLIETEDELRDVEETVELCKVDEDDELTALETDELKLELLALLDDELTALDTDELELELLALLDDEDDNDDKDDDEDDDDEEGVAQLEIEEVIVSAGGAGMETVDIIVAVYSVIVEVATGGGVEISVSTIVVEYSVAVAVLAG